MLRLTSSHRNRDQLLGVISRDRAVALLTEWTNMRGAWPGVEDEASITQTMASAEMLCRKYPDLLTDIASTPLVALRELLRKAWRAGDRREREWFVFRFRDLYRQTVM